MKEVYIWKINRRRCDVDRLLYVAYYFYFFLTPLCTFRHALRPRYQKKKEKKELNHGKEKEIHIGAMLLNHFNYARVTRTRELLMPHCILASFNPFTASLMTYYHFFFLRSNLLLRSLFLIVDRYHHCTLLSNEKSVHVFNNFSLRSTTRINKSHGRGHNIWINAPNEISIQFASVARET